MSNKPLREIIWAVDPFANENGLQLRAAAALRGLTKGLAVNIEPVYVLSAAQLNVSGEHFPNWEKHYMPAAVKALEYIGKRSKLPGLAPPKILVQPSSSLRSAVDLLVEYAQRKNADLIVVSTHARTGAPRLFLGSFAETLLYRAALPVLTVNPATKSFRKPKRILFPSDISQHSRQAFEGVVAVAKALSAGVTVFHKVMVPMETRSEYLYRYSEKEAEFRRSTAEAWINWALRQGVKTEVIIDNGVQDVPDAILSAAKKTGAGLVAMTAQSGPVAIVMLGSIARQVLRRSSCPVWVFHSKSLASL